MLKIRYNINRLRLTHGLNIIPLPKLNVDTTINPIDVFTQKQIIIADLNLLKIKMGIKNSTPIKIPFQKKTPRDVFQHTIYINYMLDRLLAMPTLLNQIKHN